MLYTLFKASTLKLLCSHNTDIIDKFQSLVQVCFPGGMVDVEDSTIVHTSLREMEEELGIVRYFALNVYYGEMAIDGCCVE